MSETDSGAAAPQMSMEELLALPVVFGLKTAARALGIGRNAAYELAAAGTFPCPVQRYGQQYRVTRPDLFRVLGLPPDAVATPSGPVACSCVGGHQLPERRLSEAAVRVLNGVLEAVGRVLAELGPTRS